MKLKKYIILCLITSLTGGLSAQKTMTGIEVLKKDNFKILERKRVGLITNPTGVDNSLKSTIDILLHLFRKPIQNTIHLRTYLRRACPNVGGRTHACQRLQTYSRPHEALETKHGLY